MIVHDSAEAALVVAAGGQVVLVVDPSADPVPWPEGPGRLALFVGDPDDPAAAAMAAELLAFNSPGGRPQKLT